MSREESPENSASSPQFSRKCDPLKKHSYYSERMEEIMRILFVEDDTVLNATITGLLEKEGFLVTGCTDGDEGYWYAEQNIYDLLLLDRMIPGRDGLTLIHDLRKARIHTPVILLTALGDIHDKVEGLDAGADDYLVKPFSMEELLARIRSIARRPRVLSEQTDTYLAGDLSFDVQKNLLASEANNSCSLSKREGHLMRLFLANPDQILTREYLLSKVWGIDDAVEDGNLDNYIHFLRRRLRAVQSTVTIATVRGIGYRLVLPHV